MIIKGKYVNAVELFKIFEILNSGKESNCKK